MIKNKMIIINQWNIVFCFMLLCIVEIKAQIVITVPTSFTDVLSQTSYQKINDENRKMLISSLGSEVLIQGVNTTIRREFNEITEISYSLQLKKTGVKRFINHKSMAFIKKKYPVFSIKGTTDPHILKNTITRTRFRIKLHAENKKADGYFESDNYISEGDRILMLLNSLENVIKTCLENEEL